MSGLNVGDKLREVDRGAGGSSIGPEVTVERLTPTGIAVLSNGSRLNPRKTFGGWEVRGSGAGNGWRIRRYHRVDSEEVQDAIREYATKRRQNVVIDAFEAWRQNRTRDNLLRLIAAAETAAKRMDE